MSRPDDQTVVYYDGACPLCRREAGLLRALTQNKSISFDDVSAPGFLPPEGLSKRIMLRRLHCRLPDGEIVDGAQAFTESWSRVPWLQWLGPIGRFGPARYLLNVAYRLFLLVRPQIQKLARILPTQKKITEARLAKKKFTQE